MNSLKEHKNILIAMTIINIFVLWNFISEGKTIHGIGYFVFFYVALFIIHFFTNKYPPKIDIEVRNPKKELKIFILFTILGVIFMSLEYYLKSGLIPKTLFTTFPIYIGLIIFGMPIGILLYLLLNKYKILNLGFKINSLSYIILGIFIWGITGIFAFVFNKEGILWSKAINEFGSIGAVIVAGVINAALPEEFFRFIFQTRFSKILKVKGLHILIAASIWAFMHFPVNYFKESESISGIFIYCIQIIPLGFIWGYLMHRTKSIIPSLIAHGFNLWGFQNG